MKKLTALLLVATMLISLVACAGEKASVDTGATGETTAAQVEETTTDSATDDLPSDLNYDGYEFTITTPWPTEWGSDSYWREEENGDVLNDAIYNRNIEVEERLGVKISVLEKGDTGSQSSELQTYILSDDDLIDMIAVGYYQSAKPLIMNGMIRSWNDVPYIDTSKDYWNSNITETLSIKDNIYLIVGDINWFSMPETAVCYFNKNVAEDNHVENLYSLVNEGKWTFDKLYEIASKLPNDINGDNKWNKDDMYGCIQNTIIGVTGFVYAANYHTVVKTDDSIEMNFATDKMQSIVEYVYNLCRTNNISFTESFNFTNESKGVSIFFQDRALFYFDVLMHAEQFRNEDSDFGIIPYPKYDENQTDYTSYCNQWGLSCAIPSNAKDVSRTGAIVEALCSSSRRLIVPAYYDKVLVGKTTRDNESEGMLDIIFKNIIYDFGISYCTDLSFIPMKSLIESKKSDIASWYAKNEKRLTNNYTELFEYVDEKKS